MNNKQERQGRFVPSERVPLESENVLDIRRQIQAFTDGNIESMGRSEEEVRISKQEMDKFLGDVFSHLKENVEIVDNPSFNFNEPITTEEPLDETLMYDVEQAEQKLQFLTERLANVRKQKIEEIAASISDMVAQESRPAREINLVTSSTTPLGNGELSATTSPSTVVTSGLNKENKERVVKEYADAMRLLTTLKKETTITYSQLDHILRRSSMN